MNLHIAQDTHRMAEGAADHGARLVRDAVRSEGHARIVLATGASQIEMLSLLVARDVPWPKVTAFHLDEYIGLEDTHPASFRRYLRERFVTKVGQVGFHPIAGDAPDPLAECDRLSRLLADPIDVAFIGIGENGHIAFNDPPVADFADPVAVKIVELDGACRQQQVNDGCFPALAAVPTHALSLTIAVFRRAKTLSVVVPGPRKAAAVRATLRDAISTAFPATILRTHAQATLFLDRASAAQLEG
jgi:glucosamine-6-phosphate deaminase